MGYNFYKNLEKIGQHSFRQAILIGDLNIDLLKCNNSKHKSVKTYLELLVSRGFLPQTVLPSRVTSNSGLTELGLGNMSRVKSVDVRDSSEFR